MSSLKRRAPQGVKRAGRRAAIAFGRRTAALRLAPSFVLVGGQRCGTTSLFRALQAHPAVLGPVFHKGVNYFDVNYDKGWNWYLGHFPTAARAGWVARRAGEPVVTFDASGYYSHHPHAPLRLAKDLPDVKILLMVRDPVERAFSAYKHEYARGFETETFHRALELEDERVEPELARMLEDPSYYSFSHRHHAYRRRGYYDEQIARFTEQLPADRILVVDSGDFFTEPDAEYRRVTEFLGLSSYTPPRFDRWNARPSDPLDPQLRERLSSDFASHDQALEGLLGRTPSWRRSGG